MDRRSPPVDAQYVRPARPAELIAASCELLACQLRRRRAWAIRVRPTFHDPHADGASAEERKTLKLVCIRRRGGDERACSADRSPPSVASPRLATEPSVGSTCDTTTSPGRAGARARTGSTSSVRLTAGPSGSSPRSAPTSRATRTPSGSGLRRPTYRVRACNAAGCSSPSNPAAATTAGAERPTHVVLKALLG